MHACCMATGSESWPATPEALTERQIALAAGNEPRRPRTTAARLIAACYVCFERDHSGSGVAGEPAWAAAALLRGHKALHTATLSGISGWAYEPGLLALRE